MEQRNFSYCVAIRTLGKAGEKYQRELDSLKNQTVQPKKILVYIAEGYELPKETIGIEQYIYVEKGMVAQRALPFTQIDTEYVLFLDDDVFLPEDAVEKLYDGLCELQGDCIVADTFCNQEMDIKRKILAFVANWAYPRKDDNWAFKIQRNASFSYNNNPSKEVYFSQSGAGPASLWKMSAFKAIHFEDERWLDNLGFAYGDDLLCFYKLYLNGFRLLVHYKSGIIHLDAGSGRRNYNENSQKLLLRGEIQFILWWRIRYNLSTNTCMDRCLNLFSYGLKFCWGVGLHLLYSIAIVNIKPFVCYLKGNYRGVKYVCNRSYRLIPNFIISDLSEKK